MFKHNLAIIKLRILFEKFEQEEQIAKKDIESFLKILSVFCPHISEELWEKLGNKSFISLENWPVADEKKINPELEKQEQQVDNLVNDINNIVKIVTAKGSKVSEAYAYTLPNELKIYSEASAEIEKRISMNFKVFAVNDKNKYDPENKAARAKPGKPAIYLKQ